MYEHQHIDAWLTAPGTAALLSAVLDPPAAGVPLRVGYQPTMCAAIYALVTVIPTVTAPVIAFKFRPLIGNAAGELVIGTLTIPVGTAVGQMIYKLVDNVRCNPGGEIVTAVTAAATVGSAHLGIMQAPSWEHPTNNPKMVRSV